MLASRHQDKIDAFNNISDTTTKDQIFNDCLSLLGSVIQVEEIFKFLEKYDKSQVSNLTDVQQHLAADIQNIFYQASDFENYKIASPAVLHVVFELISCLNLEDALLDEDHGEKPKTEPPQLIHEPVQEPDTEICRKLFYVDIREFLNQLDLGLSTSQELKSRQPECYPRLEKMMLWLSSNENDKLDLPFYPRILQIKNNLPEEKRGLLLNFRDNLENIFVMTVIYQLSKIVNPHVDTKILDAFEKSKIQFHDSMILELNKLFESEVNEEPSENKSVDSVQVSTENYLKKAKQNIDSLESMYQDLQVKIATIQSNEISDRFTAELQLRENILKQYRNFSTTQPKKTALQTNQFRAEKVNGLKNQMQDIMTKLINSIYGTQTKHKDKIDILQKLKPTYIERRNLIDLEISQTHEISCSDSTTVTANTARLLAERSDGSKKRLQEISEELEILIKTKTTSPSEYKVIQVESTAQSSVEQELLSPTQQDVDKFTASPNRAKDNNQPATPSNQQNIALIQTLFRQQSDNNDLISSNLQIDSKALTSPRQQNDIKEPTSPTPVIISSAPPTSPTQLFEEKDAKRYHLNQIKKYALTRMMRCRDGLNEIDIESLFLLQKKLFTIDENNNKEILLCWQDFDYLFSDKKGNGLNLFSPPKTFQNLVSKVNEAIRKATDKSVANSYILKMTKIDLDVKNAPDLLKEVIKDFLMKERQWQQKIVNEDEDLNQLSEKLYQDFLNDIAPIELEKMYEYTLTMATTWMTACSICSESTKQKDCDLFIKKMQKLFSCGTTKELTFSEIQVKMQAELKELSAKTKLQISLQPISSNENRIRMQLLRSLIKCFNDCQKIIALSLGKEIIPTLQDKIIFHTKRLVNLDLNNEKNATRFSASSKNLIELIQEIQKSIKGLAPDLSEVSTDKPIAVLKRLDEQEEFRKKLP